MNLKYYIKNGLKFILEGTVMLLIKVPKPKISSVIMLKDKVMMK